MNFVGRWRRKSLGWLGVTLGAFLLVGCYLVFDVLDLDQSDLYHRLLSNPFASQGNWAEGERDLRQHFAAPGAHNPDAKVIRAFSLARVLETLPRPTSAPASSSVCRVHPRAPVGRASLAPPTAPVDLPRTIAHAA